MRRVEGLVDEMLGLLFPEGDMERDQDWLESRLGQLERDLLQILTGLVEEERREAVARGFIDALPGILPRLLQDASAIAEGDPAAESTDEVVAAYPGFAAIAVHRLAHHLHQDGVRYLPRLISEVAHARTGIDIHPGATIGPSFSIDHGTGVVIGETAVIGEGVKVYQGVTLGAISVARSARGSKRHPTIEDRVVLYANATVLGGETIVGHDSIIGGNVWLTNSVPPNSFVHHTGQVRVRSVTDLLDFSDFSI